MSGTFAPPIEPSVGGVPQTATPRVNETKLGDGYSQRAAMGINSIERKVSLRWDALELPDLEIIEAFFEARAGVEWFTYTLPRESTARRWVARAWARNADSALTLSLSAELYEVHDL